MSSATCVVVVDDALLFGDRARVSFHRTLRVPDTGTHPLPPSLGNFPLRVVDHTKGDLEMLARGGVVLPIYQREALWIDFSADEPVALQVATGLVCAVSGHPLSEHLSRDPQNYVVLPTQPWLDGYKTKSGEVKQFVAAALGSGVSVEEQLADRPPVGGIQLCAFALKPEALERWRAVAEQNHFEMCFSAPLAATAMGVGAGGSIAQEIYLDEFDADDWCQDPFARVWVHLCSAAQWTELTGENPPPTPVSPEVYDRYHLPWFDYYDADRQVLEATPELANISTITELIGDDSPSTANPALVIEQGPDQRPAHDASFGTEWS